MESADGMSCVRPVDDARDAQVLGDGRVGPDEASTAS
jgi:hypothetical protein